MVVFYSDLSITESICLGEAQIDEAQSSLVMSHLCAIMHKSVKRINNVYLMV